LGLNSLSMLCFWFSQLSVAKWRFSTTCCGEHREMTHEFFICKWPLLSLWNLIILISRLNISSSIISHCSIIQ
jgi:hypothetical protein